MEQKGFLASLFDFSFTHLITLKLIRLIYIILIAFAALGTLAFVATAFASDSTFGIIVLVLSPIIFLAYTILARVYLEIVAVLFRIADNTSVMAYGTRGQQSAPPPPAPQPAPDA